MPQLSERTSANSARSLIQDSQSKGGRSLPAVAGFDKKEVQQEFPLEKFTEPPNLVIQQKSTDSMGSVNGEDDELLQAKFSIQEKAAGNLHEPMTMFPIRRGSPQWKEVPQRITADKPFQLKAERTKQKENRTGMPDQLKEGLENISGFSMDDVKVHYNSDKPAQLQALAYAQGTAIHIAPGQEKHLPHEAWHIVQQKQGRVKQTTQMKGKVNINDDAGLEKEADMIGTRALQFVDNRPESISQREMQSKRNECFYAPIQLMKKWTLAAGFENIAKAPPPEGWFRCKYKGEEIYINSSEMESFLPEDWEHITYFDEEDLDGKTELSSEEGKSEKDEFPHLKVGDVISITIIKESRSDHQYVVAMVKGGGNIKMHYGTGGGLYERSDDIDNEHGVPVESFDVPEGLTGDTVVQIFQSTKNAIQKKFAGGNCGGLASELVSELGGVSKGADFF